MNLTPKEKRAVVAAAVFIVVGVGAEALGVSSVALAALMGLILAVTALQMSAIRKIALREEELQRLEAKIDAISRRVVTESEVLSRELGGQIDGLAAELRNTP
jgi:hypothetical protein